MSFLCCCCSTRKPDGEGADSGEEVEVARGLDDSSQSQATPRKQMDRAPRDACIISSGRVLWNNRGECEILDGEDNNSEDSYDAEFARQANGAFGIGQSVYVPYAEVDPTSTNQQSNKGGAYLVSLALRTERNEFLSNRSTFSQAVLERINVERENQGCQPLNVKQDLVQLAEQLWKDRVQILHGFAVVPRCVYFPREFKRGQRYGCLTYYTPRSARIGDCVPDAMVHFWRNAGVPRKAVSATNEPAASFHTNSRCDFPVAKESYVADKTSAIANAFEKYRKMFPDQLLASGCKFVGFHADMVQIAKDNSHNVVCVTAVFDCVASAKGRKMESPMD